MQNGVRVLVLPSFRVAAVRGTVGPTNYVCQDSQPIGNQLLAWAERANVTRNAVPDIKGIALMETDWRDYARRTDRFHPEIKACVAQVMEFTQCLLIDQGVLELNYLVDRYAGAGAAAEVDLEIRHTRAGLYAVARDQGPYSQRSALRTVFLWLDENGIQLDEGPVMELYLNDPATTPENELLTDVCVPIKGMRSTLVAKGRSFRFIRELPPRGEVGANSLNAGILPIP